MRILGLHDPISFSFCLSLFFFHSPFLLSISLVLSLSLFLSCRIYFLIFIYSASCNPFIAYIIMLLSHIHTYIRTQIPLFRLIFTMLCHILFNLFISAISFFYVIMLALQLAKLTSRQIDRPRSVDEAIRLKVVKVVFAVTVRRLIS